MISRFSKLEESVSTAIGSGVQELEALRIFRESNRRAESGEWIELRIITVRDAKNQDWFPHGTSLCRYWGPMKYDGSSNNKLLKLYKDGEIGKTHEIVRGSEIYRIGGRLSEGTVSIPPIGSRVLHRHWEILQMYNYKKRGEN